MIQDTFVVGDIGGKDQVEFFWGEVREQQSRYFYPLALLFRGALLALGLVFSRKKLRSKPAAMLLWLFILIVVLLASISPKKADRYAMSVVLAIDLLAGIGWIWLVGSVLNTRGKDIRGVAAVTAGLIAGQLLFVIFSYPYILTYYNPLLGGFARATELVPVGRGEGLEQAAAWINSQPDARSATISPYYRNVSNYYLDGRSLGFSDDGESQLLADYVVFYITQTQRKLPFPGVAEYFQNKVPAFVLTYGNTPYVWVYRREQPITKLDGKPEIVGRARLVGYHVSEKNWAAGISHHLVLYLLTANQELPENEAFRVSLVDQSGNEHGTWRSAVDNQWAPNSVVEWEGTLTLPAKLPADDYKLKIALIDTNIKVEVASFPFDDEMITVASVVN
jgi:hypothetical protein